jgi:pentatricopeptide repeat protein
MGNVTACDALLHLRFFRENMVFSWTAFMTVYTQNELFEEALQLFLRLGNGRSPAKWVHLCCGCQQLYWSCSLEKWQCTLRLCYETWALGAIYTKIIQS